MRLSEEQYNKFLGKSIDNKLKQSKYKNKKVVVNGIKFDSQLEANHYKTLLLLERAGAIKDLRLQVKFELQPSFNKNGKHYQAINYVADFVYYDISKEKTIVADSKGYKTEVYKLKKKMFEYKYSDLELKEIGGANK